MQYGQFYVTRGVFDKMERCKGFREDITLALMRYVCGDWGEVCKEDWDLNDESAAGDGRTLAVYPTCEGKIWIITEWDRSATTILFPDEY